MEELNNRVAVVTGGASGIGNGMARAFAAEGMKLVLADIESASLTQATQKLADEGARVIGVECDVSDPAAVEALRDRALSEFGAVHVLCNNAGVAGSSPAASWEAPLGEWDWVMGVNLRGVIHGVRSFIPLMIEQAEGHVVNTSSMAGLMNGMGIYGVTKHAVVALSESIYSELAGRQLPIGISVLCPAWVRTRIMESERNRPEAPREDPGEYAQQAQVMQQIVAGLVEKGLDPLDVGRTVVKAIREERFYVLTHPSWKNTIAHRAENILEDRAPVGVPPATEAENWNPELA